MNVTMQNVPQAVLDQSDFNASTMHGRTLLKGSTINDLGRLPLRFVSELHWAVTGFDSIYVVWSYQTPIAWRSGHTWWMPEATYSKTTRKHQIMVTNALTGKFGPCSYNDLGLMFRWKES